MKQLPLQQQEFANYLEAHKKLIAKVARTYCSNTEEQKDLIQDIIVQLWQSFGKYDKKFALSTWTYRIAINVSISYLRKKTTLKNTQSGYGQHLDLLSIEETKLDDKLVLLYKFIERLKPLDKAVILLQLEGQNNKEISEIMGFSASNISTRKHRIKEELKKYFESSNQ